MNEISKIKSFPLGSVRMTDPYCVNALDKEIEYLKSFDNDRVLSGFRQNAGLAADAKPYGGWESHLIGGHAMGHYFSALAQAAVNPGTPENDRAVLRKKLEEIIAGLHECQLPNGFLWAGRVKDPENVEIQFDLVEQGRGNENIIEVAWVPWYTMHKILAGLVAAYSVAGIDQALDVAKKLGDWVYSRTESWSEDVRKTVLNTEYGGMNDVMYELYAVTGDSRYAKAAHAFDEEPLMKDILTNRENVLTGRHANTTIPKIIGMLRRYQLCEGADGEYLSVAKVFWDNVMLHHTYHTGGNSEWEHFRADDSLDKNRTNCNCETCNVYNMLKLTRELFKVTGEAKYAEYLENAFFNHILASQDPKTGMTTYFQSMATGYFKVFSSPWDDFWCCTGSGMENFTKLGDSTFFKGDGCVYIVKYLSCELCSEDIKLSLQSSPACDKVKITVCSKSGLTLKLRVPDWSDGFIDILKNGEKAAYELKDGFAVIEVCDGDVLDTAFRASIKVKTLCDNKNAVALKYGPWLLAAKLGKENMEIGRTGVHVAIPAKSVSDGVLKPGCTAQELISAPEKYVRKSGELEFELGGLSFIPYREIEERYGIYWVIEK